MLAQVPLADPERAARSSINNVLARLNGEASWVEDALEFPVFMGQHAALERSEGLLYIGCEEKLGSIATIRRARE